MLVVMRTQRPFVTMVISTHTHTAYTFTTIGQHTRTDHSYVVSLQSVIRRFTIMCVHCSYTDLISNVSFRLVTSRMWPSAKHAARPDCTSWRYLEGRRSTRVKAYMDTLTNEQNSFDCATLARINITHAEFDQIYTLRIS